MLFSIFTFALIFFVHGQTAHSNYQSSFTKLFHEEYDKFLKIDVDIDHSCFVKHDFFTLTIICPTDLNCYFITYLHQKYNRDANYPIHLEHECRTWDNRPIAHSKVEQLRSVHRLLNLANETACAFASVRTLDLRASGLNDMGRVGGGNCQRVSRCPYELKYLNVDKFSIQSLFNNSFCQFRKLEFLGVTECGLRAIEADAFVYLGQLRELVLNRNYLTHLPVDLFRNNTRLEAVNLRNNQLQTQGLKPLLAINSLRYLYFSDNLVTLGERQLTFPTNLQELLVNNNGLSMIGSEFVDLKNLSLFVASNNNISEIQENAFENMSEVKTIDLDSNHLEQLHPRTYKNNVNLESLILSNNRLIEFPSIGHLGSLKKIQLANNKIGFVNKSHLINCSQLSFVDLSSNRLVSIENASFDHLERLQKLIISGNRLSQSTVNFENARALEINLDFNRFTEFSYRLFSPSLQKLSVASNEIERMEGLEFNRQIDWSLTHLALNNNKMRFMNNLKLPFSIQEINLSHNRFNETLTIAGIIRRELTNVRSVDMRGNNISLLCKLHFLDKISQRVTYYVSGNPLKCACENNWLKYPRTSDSFTFEDLRDIDCQEMNPYRNPGTLAKLTQLPDEAFLCKSNHDNSNRCNCPLDDRIQCESPCPANCSCLSDYYQTNAFFMCGHHDFTHIPKDFGNFGRFHARSRMNVLDLSGNSIARIEANDFDNFTLKFVTLEMSNSGVKFIAKNAFDKLVHLQILNLANNEIEVLPDGIFHELTQLKYLDLSNNYLGHVADDAFRSQANLQFLYLHNNSLSRIDLHQITRLGHLSNVTLDDNPWSCDCSFIDSFRSFLVDSSTPVNNKLRLNCTGNGEDFNIPNFNMDHCSVKVHLSVLIVSLTFGVLSFVTAALMFQWRYELQVLVYVRYGYRMFHTKQPKQEAEGKQYDAFVAYNSNDTDFLVKELMPGLEKIENPYRLCIHERDFPAGSYIQDSIVDAIAMSSRTIIILSEHFVNSGWCRFEFKSAHMQMLQDKCPRILVILLGEVPGTLDPEMKLYLKTNTYLKWGEKLFWHKLYYAMPDKRVTTPPTDIMPMRDF